jgi:hypothetical protein
MFATHELIVAHSRIFSSSVHFVFLHLTGLRSRNVLLLMYLYPGPHFALSSYNTYSISLPTHLLSNQPFIPCSDADSYFLKCEHMLTRYLEAMKACHNYGPTFWTFAYEPLGRV